jgi:hypothetical protein
VRHGGKPVGVQGESLLKCHARDDSFIVTAAPVTGLPSWETEATTSRSSPTAIPLRPALTASRIGLSRSKVPT